MLKINNIHCLSLENDTFEIEKRGYVNTYRCGAPIAQIAQIAPIAPIAPIAQIASFAQIEPIAQIVIIAMTTIVEKMNATIYAYEIPY